MHRTTHPPWTNCTATKTTLATMRNGLPLDDNRMIHDDAGLEVPAHVASAAMQKDTAATSIQTG
jgi:hypothetical protein